VKNKKLPTNEI